MLEADFSDRVQQGELLNFLVCRQQIALDPVGKKLQAALALLAAPHPLALGREPLRNPHRQGLPVHCAHGNGYALAVECCEPGAGPGGFVELRQGDQAQRAVIACCAVGQTLEHGTALNARFARGNAQFEQLAIGKQAHAAGSSQHLAPVKAGTRHGEGAALAKALGASHCSDAVTGLLHQQQLLAIHRVEALEPAFEVVFKLAGGDLHRQSLALGCRPKGGPEGLKMPDTST